MTSSTVFVESFSGLSRYAERGEAWENKEHWSLSGVDGVSIDSFCSFRGGGEESWKERLRGEEQGVAKLMSQPCNECSHRFY